MKTPAKVKICGITQPEQARQIAGLGADYLGFNFWPQSMRYLPPERAIWLAELPDDIVKVGVFVNPQVSEMQQLAETGLVSMFQLHGDEPPEFCARLMERGLKIVKAFQVRDADSLKRIADYPVMDILLDAYHPGQRGGIGKTFPWSLALEFKALYPEKRLWLAGGLTPDNVTEATQGVQPFVVDTASGVEDDTPGVKNLDKAARFIQSAHAAR